MNKVSVIILNYKVKDETIRCIKSVQDSTYKNIELIVIDNNSQDGLENELKKFKLKDVNFINNQENLGYSGGNNVGIKYAQKNRSDFIFILNPDTTIDKKCVEKCVEAMKDKGIGIIGPKVLFADKKTIWYAGGVFDKSNVIGNHKGVDEEDLGQYNSVEETDFVSGGALFVRAEVFEKVGLFDEKYFLYYEDSDLCQRAREQGFMIKYIPEAIVYHANAKSTGLGSPLQDYYITRNRMLFASKFLSFRTQFALIREAIRNLSIPARRLALRDYLLGKFGKGGVNA